MPYIQFMRDLASSLASDAEMIEQDVEDIYNFEKDIAIVNTFISFVMNFIDENI